MSSLPAAALRLALLPAPTFPILADCLGRPSLLTPGKGVCPTQKSVTASRSPSGQPSGLKPENVMAITFY